MTRTIAIVGAGPAGLTAAVELLRHTSHRVLVFDLDKQVGGISKTVCYDGNRMDLGGHRFFSKSDWVMRWWEDILPIECDSDEPLTINYQNRSHSFHALSHALEDKERRMLVRPRLSRIFYRRKFFDYPLKINARTLSNLGIAALTRSAASYGWSRIARRTPECTLEDFFINRFGRELYLTFFKDYTEKVWGVPCNEISAEWGSQRVKGLSITKALLHAAQRVLRVSNDVAQKGVETSLIERFLYPKYGPGQMWEEAARKIQVLGGEIHLQHRVVGIRHQNSTIRSIEVVDDRTGSHRMVNCDTLISTMPVAQLVHFLNPENEHVAHVARSLPYRDFMTAGLIVRRMKSTGDARESSLNGMPPDNWIYVQEPDVKLGRLQVFNNWSPHLVSDPSTISLGLEYFCKEGDELWSMQDSSFLDFAARELEKIGLIDRTDVLNGTVVRVPKAYPAYFGTYQHIDQVRDFLDTFENLYPVGRNGMHRYNNQDHSMLAAKAAVDAIEGNTDKRAIWEVNAEEDYHEEKQTSPSVPAPAKAA
jgi:protoporphyrinogen oxidase